MAATETEETDEPDVPDDDEGEAASDGLGDGEGEPEEGNLPAPIGFTASICPGDEHLLPEPFVEAVVEIQQILNAPVWLLLQTVPGPCGYLDESMYHRFYEQRRLMEPGQETVLIVDSPGGSAKGAYQLARLFRNQCGGFVAIVPEYAKSAATLLTLGADRLIMSPLAELGPLDVQYPDPEREQERSGLDEVHSLERLHAFAMTAVDTTMILLMRRMRGKRTDTVLPLALDFVSGLLEPLFDKIDTVHYTMMSRMFKEAEDYATRLLRPRLGQRSAELARKLVQNFPCHSFVIDAEEAEQMGLPIELPDDALQKALDRLVVVVPDEYNVVGRIVPVYQGDDDEDDA